MNSEELEKEYKEFVFKFSKVCSNACGELNEAFSKLSTENKERVKNYLKQILPANFIAALKFLQDWYIKEPNRFFFIG